MKSPGKAWSAVRWRLKATRRLWRAGVTPEMPFLAPEPSEVIAPEPFDARPRGNIDAPVAGAAVAREKFEGEGWALFPSGPTARVELWLGEMSLGRARLGARRPDVDALSENPFAAVCGFNLTVDLREWDPAGGETLLRVVATGTGGERLELEPVQVVVSAPRRKMRASTGMPPPPAHTPKPPGRSGRRVLVCTHQLDLGGAQLYLVDLLREMLRQGSIEPTVVSALDGLLRKELEELGVPVHISSLVPPDDLSSHIGRVEELAAWLSDREFDVAFVNTATVLAVPGAEAAGQLGIPAVWSIHESFPLTVLWHNMSPEVRERAEGALGDAALVVFEAEATRRLFESLIDADRSVMVPYGIDLEPIDAERAAFDRRAARRSAGFPDAAEVVLCVGTVEPRKAQVPLAQAFELIADRRPNARLVFVGGRESDPDSVALADWIDSSPSGDRTELVPITPHVGPWYGLADLFVCAADVESLPRTVLEAMAWETPVVATSIFGLPELIDDGKTGWLCEPRDIAALADGLDRALGASRQEREAIGQAARALVERRHSLECYAREVSRLLDSVADGAAVRSTHAAAR